MADDYTHFCCRLGVGAANVEQAFAIYQSMAAELYASDAVTIGFRLKVADDDPGALWICDSDGYGTPENVIAFALQCAEAFDLHGRWGFCWALSRPSLNSFGGGGRVLDFSARKTVTWLDCSHWLAVELMGEPDDAAR